MVLYGETEAYGQWVDDPQVSARHAVTLTGLSPYTVYHYRLQVSDAPLSDALLSDDYAFRTAAGLAQAGFSFAVFGDTRSQRVPHQAVVDRVLSWGPDLVIHTGDLVGLSTDDWWQIFFEVERELMARAPLFPTVGNHEKDSPLYRELFYLPGNERWYSFDYGQAHFVCLQVDTFADLSQEGEQIRWLRADLASTGRPWKFVFFHIPPYSSSFGDQAEEVLARQALVPILAENGVQAVFSGHHHNYQRFYVDGITYLVLGGGGAPLYAIDDPPDPQLIASAVEYHALWATLEGTIFTAVAISAEGEELDRFTLELP